MCRIILLPHNQRAQKFLYTIKIIDHTLNIIVYAFIISGMNELPTLIGDIFTPVSVAWGCFKHLLDLLAL